MPSAPRSLSAGRIRVALAALAMAAAASFLAAACSTEEEIIFGDPACPANRCQAAGAAGGTGEGTDCTNPDENCAVHFAADIFDPIFDANGSAKCANTQCHGNPMDIQGDLLLVPGDAFSSREALLKYQFDKPAGPYITCKNPPESRILCNMFLGIGVTNTYGKCLTTMPLIDELGAEPLTEMQLELIAQWIACGAPNN
jgi:hypothetical protein